jgi:hypothetical protein
MSLTELQQRCSRLAAEAFRRDELRAMVWLTQTADGALAEFDTPCWAPKDIGDSVALGALQEEMAADFARDRIVAYAVAFIGWVAFTGVGSALLAQPPTVRRRVVVVEAYDDRASVVATRDIVPGEWPRLGPLQRHARATGRFGGLLAAVHETAARDV